MAGDRDADADARIAALEAALAVRDAQNGELVAQIAKLIAQVEKLTDQLSRNSTNSHLPPSSDGPGARRDPPRGNSSKAGRKRGGQKGHRGSHRELLSPEVVDEIVDLVPDVCEGCARDLPKTLKPVGNRRYQQLDLRDHRPHLIEFRRHEVECDSCGCRTIAAYDLNKIPSSAFGPCITATVAMLSGVYHLSRRKVQQLIKELLGITVSLGAISTMERRIAESLEAAYEEAHREVESSSVKHTDATSWLRAGALKSLCTLASASATVYRIFTDGCRDTIRPFFGELHGILISDRASVFDFWTMKARQICWAHLLRKFVAFSERDGPVRAIGRALLEYTSLLFEYWHGVRDGLISRKELEQWMRPIRIAVERTLERGASTGISRFSNVCANILSHREALWTFVSVENVEPTNNHAERELRGFVLWRKRSFGTQSERGEHFAERIMTVAHTARKQKKGVLDFIVKSFVALVNGVPRPQMFSNLAG